MRSWRQSTSIHFTNNTLTPSTIQSNSQELEASGSLANPMALFQLTYSESLLTLVDSCHTLLTILALRSSASLAHCIHEQTISLTNMSTNRLNLITLEKHYTAMDFHLIYVAVITLLSNLFIAHHTQTQTTDTTFSAFISIPYVQGISEPIKRVLAQVGSK